MRVKKNKTVVDPDAVAASAAVVAGPAVVASKPPADDDDNDEDNDEEKGDEEEDDEQSSDASQEGDEQDGAAHSECCTTAVDAMTRAIDAVKASGDDPNSLADLKACKAAANEAIEELTEVSSSCDSLLAVEGGDEGMDQATPPVEQVPSGAPAPGASIVVPTAVGALSMANAAAFAQKILGSKDPQHALALLAFGERMFANLQSAEPKRAKSLVSAEGVFGAILDNAAAAKGLRVKLAAETAKLEASRREDLWELAVEERRVQLGQAFAKDADGKRVYARFADDKNREYPTLAAFEGWISTRNPEAGSIDIDPDTRLGTSLHPNGTSTFTEKEIAQARKLGIPLEILDANRQQMSRATGAHGV